MISVKGRIFDKCVYTIVDLNVIDQSIENDDLLGTFIEKKSWRKAIELGQQAVDENKYFLLLLANASYIDGVCAAAIIEGIEILDNGGTKISFSCAQYLKDIQPLSKLHLLSSGKPLSDWYIRPYALCQTPNFAYKYAENLLSALDSVEESNPERANERPDSRANEAVPAGSDKPRKTTVNTPQYERDPLIRDWVIKKVNGICECCKRKGPFEAEDGSLYLEIHHVRQLSAGGSDRVSNTVALCPNCHRELHHGKRKKELIERLYKSISRLIRE